MTKRKPLVCQHLENVPRPELDEIKGIVKKLARGHRGIYALYGRGKLQHVGRVSTLPKLLPTHLRDKREGTWDRFSMYLSGSEGPRELELLVLRVILSTGSKRTERFGKSRSLGSEVRRLVREKQRMQVDRNPDPAGQVDAAKIPRARQLRRLRTGPPVRPRDEFDHAALTQARVARDVSIRQLAHLVSQETGIRVSFDAMRKYSRGGHGVPDEVVASVARVLGRSARGLVVR